MDLAQVSLAAAFAAGLLSFFSPCVVPLVPIYLGYMTGAVVAAGESAGRLRPLAHALAFIIGFSLVFALLGAAAGLLGGLLTPLMPWILRLGGLLLLLMGLHLMGWLTLPFLNMEKRLEVNGGQGKGLGASLLVGIVFAAGWTPCIGPVLTAILLLAADSQTAWTGAGLLAVYSLGLGVPFLAVAALLDVIGPWLRRVGRAARVAQIIGGALLALMGLALLAGYWQQLAFRLGALSGA